MTYRTPIRCCTENTCYGVLEFIKGLDKHFNYETEEMKKYTANARFSEASKGGNVKKEVRFEKNDKGSEDEI